ncbi:MAG: penicillin acylase family protein [Acidobacteria bacterium]|nr:penicillin acylase family protein [Acidobacteriota bacterium]
MTNDIPAVPAAGGLLSAPRRWLRVLLVMVAVIGVVLLMAGLWIRQTVAGSLPILEGDIGLAGLTTPVTIERDVAGVPTIRGSNRPDLARAMGFLHAQERFFQMDLSRRQAAGELAELFGEAALAWDRQARRHQFRRRAGDVLALQPEPVIRLLTAYTDGVNAGLAALDEVPFEYLLLRSEPAPWQPIDSLLVLYSMFFALQDHTNRRELDRAVLREALPAELAAFLDPPGGEWDAPVAGEPFPVPAIPGPDMVNVRHDTVFRQIAGPAVQDPYPATCPGSNNWAVAGQRTVHGGALVANDMHLGHAVPNTWYRAVMTWPAAGGTGDNFLVGVTLPGTPALVVGSNTRIAWGFTNSYGDWHDLVVVEPDPADPDRYLAPDGSLPFGRETETIRVQGRAEPEILEIRTTIWGPLTEPDQHQRPLALNWTAHHPAAVNMNLLALEQAANLDEALAVAATCGIPAQNFVCADHTGRVGWTIMGRIPRRVGFDGSVPVSWADGSCRWDGWFDPADYPRLADPADGLIWTANARVVGGAMLAVIGDGGYNSGARARQIRDGLRALDQASEADMLRIQQDDRALFLERWRELLLAVLTPEATANHPARAEFRCLAADSWTRRASVDSVGYTLVRTFRLEVREEIYRWLTAPCTEVRKDFSPYFIHHWEGPLWRLVREMPPHLLPPAYASWEECLLAAVDRTIERLTRDGRALAENPWGRRNTTAIRHPISRATGLFAAQLDMPARPLPGDTEMPRVQSPGFGASERLVVSPGREDQGIFHMPCGQSGHPFSPYYRAGHTDWEEGNASPLLPGETIWRLTLRPQK